MAMYYVSLIAGLEDVTAKEIRDILPGAECTGQERGRLFFSYEGDPRDTLFLRTVENVFAWAAFLDNITPDEEWLMECEKQVAAVDLDQPLALLRRIRDFSAEPSFRVTAQRSGEHEFNSQMISAATGSGVVERCGWRVDLTGFDVDVRIDVRQDRAVLGVRLSEETLHLRSRVMHSRASLNTTVAAAMCRLLDPQPGEVFMDPMCGAGTLLVERYALDPNVILIGSDLYTEKLDMSLCNLQAAGIMPRLIKSDARRMAIGAGSVDKIACNMPWGRLVASHRINRHLYPRFLSGVTRVVRPGGLIALLTVERRLMNSLLEQPRPLRTLSYRRLSVGGLEPSLYILQRTV